MKQEVTITIEGKQSFPGSEPEAVRTQARGTLEDRGEAGVLLSYRESEDSGLEGVVTTLQVEPGRVVLTRTGALSSRMVFEEGKEYRCTYATPYGTIGLTVRTRKLQTHLDSQGGEVTIDYDLEMDGAGVGRHALYLQVSPIR